MTDHVLTALWRFRAGEPLMAEERALLLFRGLVTTASRADGRLEITASGEDLLAAHGV